MNKKEIYCLIRYFELEAGEDFFDQNETIIQPYQLIFWLLGKKYITPKQFNLAVSEKLLGLNEIFTGYEKEYAIFPNGEAEEIPEKYKYYIIAELMQDCEVYQHRLKKILEEHNLVINALEIPNKQWHEYRNTVNDEYKELNKLTIERIKNNE
ncbi:MAG: hypothetical protein PVG30_01950 [Gammaproteobacteria bacterium]|jgi:hypothetical protein